MDKLKNEKRWCIWKYEDRNGNRSKVPYQDYTTRGASNNPDCWIRYVDAKQIKDEHNEVGIGLYLSPREENHDLLLCAIDIDAHHTDGAENQYATEILEIFHNTYIERSPSGNGYHILCYFDQSRTDERDIKSRERIVDADGNFAFYKKNAQKELEIYIAGFTNRFMTVTENVLNTNGVVDQTEEILQFLDQYMQKPETQRMQVERRQSTGSDTQTDLAHREGGIFSFTDPINIKERLAVARRSKYGQQFIDLYDNGNLSDYDDDHSKADFALVRKLYYWLNGDPLLIDKAFRSSKLMRDKWDEMRGSESYGHLTIRKVMSLGGAVWRPYEQVTQVQPSQWMDSLGIQPPEENVEQVPDTTINGGTITPDDVLSMINEVQDDVKNWDRITVLPLMCGTGKSSAIRLKIRQIIESNSGDGLIIVTDNIDRMRDYLNPEDIELSEFFMNHKDLITVMTADSVREANIYQRRTPVLIMATQRYVRLTHQEIENYLEWEGGHRSLIIVDEQPMFKQQCNISMKDITEIKRAIKDGILHTEEDKPRLMELWRRIGIELDHVQNTAHLQTEPGQHYYYYKPSLSRSGELSFVWPAPFQKELDIIMLDEAERLTNKFRKQINDSTSFDNSFIDLATKAQTIIDMLRNYALIQARVYQMQERKPVKVYFSYLLDNYAKYRNLDAKVIILDGTADVSVAYQLYDDLDMRDCNEFKRKLSNLHVKIINMATGKSSLTKHEECQKKLKTLEEYLSENLPEGVKPVVFSYKSLEEQLAHTFGETNRDWFGNIKGKNDYRKATHIAQFGLNRFPDGSYFLYMLAKNPGIIERSIMGDSVSQDRINNMRILPTPNTDKLIKQLMNSDDAYAKEAMRREILADLEQNLFRGIIRNSNSKEDYTFYLFTSHHHTQLINDIINRYQSELQGHVEMIQLETEETDYLSKLMSHNRKGERTNFQRIVDWHDNTLLSHSFYDYGVISAETKLSEKAIKKARQKVPMLNRWLIDENKEAESFSQPENIIRREGRPKTKYYKTRNWYYDESE